MIYPEDTGTTPNARAWYLGICLNKSLGERVCSSRDYRSMEIYRVDFEFGIKMKYLSITRGLSITLSTLRFTDLRTSTTQSRMYRGLLDFQLHAAILQFAILPRRTNLGKENLVSSRSGTKIPTGIHKNANKTQSSPNGDASDEAA